MKPYFYSADEYFKETFGKKIYRLSLDGGMTCPNRDGTKGTGGCIFCSSLGSGDFAAQRKTTVTEQLEAAKSQVKNKLPKNGAPYGYATYYQSYTNTYAPVETLRRLFTETIRHPDVEALFIGTMPDCLPEPVLALLKELSAEKPVYVELGFQTAKQESAEYINRCYDNIVFETAVRAKDVQKTIEIMREIRRNLREYQHYWFWDCITRFGKYVCSETRRYSKKCVF